MSVLVAVGLLVAAALAVAIPRRGRDRLAAIRHHAPRPRLPSVTALLVRWVERVPGRVTAVAAAGTGAVLLVWQGPIAGVVGAGYAAIGVDAAMRRRARRRGATARAQATDAIAGLASDLRAGLAPVVALGSALPAFLPTCADGEATAGENDRRWGAGPLGLVEQCCGDPDRGVAARRLVAAWRLAERTGAPLADVLERLDRDLRADERARALAEAQTAGARTTAVLLAALPLAGLGLGYAIGTDPLDVLLHTPIGAVLALAAVALQLAGLVWSSRLTQVVATPGAT